MKLQYFAKISSCKTLQYFGSFTKANLLAPVLEYLQDFSLRLLHLVSCTCEMLAKSTARLLCIQLSKVRATARIKTKKGEPVISLYIRM